jgi:hypothetical protein
MLRDATPWSFLSLIKDTQLYMETGAQYHKRPIGSAKPVNRVIPEFVKLAQEYVRVSSG